MATIKNDSTTNTIISGTNNADSIANRANYVTIESGKGNDTIYNASSTSNVIIDAGNGLDYVYNYGSTVTINGGLGNDFVQNSSAASNVTLDGGDGDDSIYNWGTIASIRTGAGNDYVVNHGAQLTINSSEGSDTFVASYDDAELIQVSGGNLLIRNFDCDDTLQLVDGSLDNFSTDGGNLIFNISNGSSVTLRNMANHAITVADADGNASTQVYGTGYSPLSVIQNFMRSIQFSSLTDRTALLDEAIKACSHFNSIQDVIDSMISARALASSANRFLEDYCGIILGNDDTGAITGWDAGGLVDKDINSIMVETLPADTLGTITGATYSKGGLNITYNQDESTLSTEQKRILQGAYSWWIEESSALIEESFGLDFDDNAVTLDVIDNSELNYWGLTTSNREGNTVTLNLKYTHFEDDEDDLDANSVDRCIAHELTHVAQNVYLKSMPQFLKEGMAELTGGVDDTRVNSINRVSASADSLSAYLDLSNYSTGNRYYYATGYMFWRYLAKQASDAYDSSTAYSFSENALLEGTAGDDLLTAWGTGLTIDAKSGDDTINVYGQDEMIIAGDGDDLINISSVAGGITVNGGAGNDTITGSDYGERFLFNYLSGDDVITNFGTNDTLKSTKGTIKSIATVGADVVVTLKRSKTTATVTLVDAAGYTFKKSGSKLTVIDTISNDMDGVTLNGTSKAEVIINSGSNVTIDAGKGNDTITGSDGGDRFLFNYTSGNDVITNFGVDDTLQNTAGTMSYKKSGDDYVVKIKRGSTSATITLLDVATDYKLKKKGKMITLKSKSGSSAQEAADADYWFIDEPTNESPLSEIVEPESAIDLSTDFMVETLERKTEALIGASRHRSKK